MVEFVQTADARADVHATSKSVSTATPSSVKRKNRK